MKLELEYNARSIPAVDIARSFIPPEPHFARLLARNHTLLLGPRGSGKTTLLKMLTARALNNWQHPQATTFAREVTFNAAFVPADIAWGRQIEAFDRFNYKTEKKEAAFVLHTLRSLVFSMREAVELGRSKVSEHARHLAIEIDADQERQLVRLVADGLQVKPRLETLLGLELALESRLDTINVGNAADHSFNVDSFPSKISMLVSAFNGISRRDDRRWALLFDEMEIVPTGIKSFLLSGIRSFDERIIVKLALAPFMDDAGLRRTPTSPQPLHDYQTVQLTYPNKDDATQFSAELFRTTFERVGIQVRSLPRMFESPNFGRSFGRAPSTPRARRGIPEEFKELATKDDSFAKYVSDRDLLSPTYIFSENNIAQDIRKVLPIVIARNFFLRRFEGGRVVAERSRKSHALYAGYPAIMEITEGNPRAILTCVGPMARQFLDQRSDGGNSISLGMQTQAIRRVELLLTSLLQVVPLDLGGFEPGKGLLDFVDQIGRSFEDRLLKGPFSTDYVGTFVLDSNVTDDVISAVGKALNAGAIIHVPHPESGPDTLLRGLRGQRFRLSYALASRYRLLLTLGDRVNLSRLLLEMRGVDIRNAQQTLFDTSGKNGDS
jgi:hypothetical protein